MTPITLSNLSQADRDVLDLIRYEGAVSVAHLCDLLQVTATAVRQKLTKLQAGGLIETVQERQERGRPLNLYRLTQAGLRAMGDNLADLAEVLWLEILKIQDSSIRQQVIDGVLQRLIDQYRPEVSGATITERLRSIAAIFRKRKIPFVVENDREHAQMRIVGCPYPRLNNHGDEICRLEQRLVASLLDAPVALGHCRCGSSGGQCCAFSASSQQELNQQPLHQLSQGMPQQEKQHSTPTAKTGP